MDLGVTLGLAAAFGVLVVLHARVVVGLWRARLRWESVLSLMVPPLAPLLAWRAGHRRGAVLWLTGIALYAVARVTAAS